MMKQTTLWGAAPVEKKRKIEDTTENNSEKKPKLEQGKSEISYQVESGPTTANPLNIQDPDFEISSALSKIPGKEMRHKQDLDLLVFRPFLSGPARLQLFNYLRAELPFYRVCYSKGPMQINTPRFTTVFGIDETNGAPSSYKIQPRSIPLALRQLKDAVEEATQAQYNFVLVNYYQSGSDSISYHSDDEKFLGPNPCIASLSLGGERDFYLKNKGDSTIPIEKIRLASGDMIVMRGTTQIKWLHAVPKRTSASGRINITFRKAVTHYGTDNYYNYNVGTGPVFRWDGTKMQKT